MTPEEAIKLILSATQWMYSRHAIARMRQRQISREDIRYAVDNHTACTKSTTNDKAWLVTGPDRTGEVIEVSIVVEILLVGDVRNVVITVMGQ